MIQRLALDRKGRGTYYEAVAIVTLVLSACQTGSGGISTAPMAPLSELQVRAWVDETVPTDIRRYDLEWRYRTQRGGAGGRASVRFAPPDSIRFDYRGPFGRSGAAMVVGDSVIWSEPEEDVSELIPVAPLFWAGLGVARGPVAGAQVSGRDDPGERSWRYVLAGDTLSYIVHRGREYKLEAELRRFGDVVGTVELEYDGATMEPSEAMLRFPGAAAILQMTVEGIESLEALEPDVWKRPI